MDNTTLQNMSNKELEGRIADMKEHIYTQEMADDFYYSSGRSRVDKSILWSYESELRRRTDEHKNA